MRSNHQEKIYLAGGCFWGLQAYMDRIKGVVNTTVGYANGVTPSPTYQEVCAGHTGYAEAVEVVFDTTQTSLEKILDAFFYVVDPTQYKRQGADIGDQYRNGVYYEHPNQKIIAESVIRKIQEKYEKRVVTELEQVSNYALAEEYHQKYLEKNPSGYCHIQIEDAEVMNSKFE